jgi:hypothetical protein
VWYEYADGGRGDLDNIQKRYWHLKEEKKKL